MDKTEENKTTADEPQPVYPEPTKGPLSDDHSDYAQPKKFVGADPDKHLHLYYIGFVVLMCFLFVVAIQAVSGVRFIF